MAAMKTLTWLALLAALSAPAAELPVAAAPGDAVIRDTAALAFTQHPGAKIGRAHV